MKVSSLFGDAQASQRANGPVDLLRYNGTIVLSVPAPNNVRYLIEIEDRDIGTVQSLMTTLMGEDHENR